MKQNTIKIYVEVLDEGSPTIRPTQALMVEDGMLKLLPAEGYNPEDEKWAFPPGSIVRGEKKLTETKRFCLP